jgi:hypothetical protein
MRVLVLGLGAILVFFSAVGLILYFKPGGSTPGETEPPIFVAGPLEGFEPGTVSYFELDHVYLIRFQDEALLALYDLGPNIQALVKGGDEAALDCRIEFIKDENGLAHLGNPPPGFDDRVFLETCQGNVWDAMGHYLTGPDEVDLDRFPLGVVDGVVRVDVTHRRCMNPVSEDAPCIATQ